MKIRKLALENIRSYVSQTLNFPEGSCLLRGNIGSGKSSVLLAIDFALFGLQRDNLAGAALLRNGADRGSVTLHFSLAGEDIVLHRALKRGKSGVSQDAGYIIRDGVKEEKTPVELKQLVLELLAYPSELLTKNKSLIFRYTVYTPQEEMKQILLGKKEERLDTLRRVFGVDKYKRIRDNAKVVVSHIRGKKRMYEGAVADLPEKVSQHASCVKDLGELQVQIQLLAPQFEEKRLTLEQAKKDVQALEEQKVLLHETKQALAVAQTGLRHLLEGKKGDLAQLQALAEDIARRELEDLSLVES